MFQPDDIKIVVTGGETQGAWRMFGGSYRGQGDDLGGRLALISGGSAPDALRTKIVDHTVLGASAS